MGLACVLSRFLFVPYCLVCGKPNKKWLCKQCQNFLEPSIPECYGCRKVNYDYCTHASCLNNGVPFVKMTVLWKYSQVSKKMLLAFKYQEGRQVGELLTKLVESRLKDINLEKDTNQVIIPVPLFWTRKLGRGFNQSEIIAQAVQNILGGEINTKTAKRVINNKKQAKLSRKDRLNNVKDIFEVMPTFLPTKVSKIIVVDDVLSTSATINSLGQALKKVYPQITLEGIVLFRGRRVAKLESKSIQ